MAAQIIAVEELRADRKIKHGDASLLFVVGEEKGGPGMLAVNKMDLTWETVIFGEPTESKLAVGHKGHYVFELFVEGIAAHSGYPDEGRSANSVLVSLLEELKAIEYPASRILGSSTFHCGKIEGGAAYNVLAADAYALCSVRIAGSLEIVEKQVLDATSRHPGVTLKKIFGYPETHLDHDIEGMFSFLTSSGSVVDTRISGLETMAVSYGTDVPRLRGNHKKYLYGPGSILHAHGPSEQVRIPDLVDSVAVYKRLVLNSLVKDCS
jgi:acetylornithine deacetylase/succinyl-diaminopimelate desuccinylase-like protein